MVVTLHASDSAVHILGVGTFRKDLDIGEGVSLVRQSIENTETMYFFDSAGAQTIVTGTWTYRIWLSRGNGGGGSPTCDVSIVILDNIGAVKATIGSNNHTADSTASTLFTGSFSSVAEQVLISTDRIALRIDNVVAGARELECSYDDSPANLADTLLTYPEATADYGNDVQGVAIANIAKIMGVSKSNITKVQGI